MYSPKISEELVPVLYRLGKERKMPMTRLIDGIIRQALESNSLPDGKNAISGEKLDPPETDPRNAA